MDAAITFVIPAYNAAATIPSTLSSLIAQTRADWTCVVVDDGSTDDTSQVVSQVATGEPRVRLIETGHVGVCGARNAGIAAASTEWICFLDADDRISPRYVERMLAATGGGIDLAYCGYVRELPSGNPLRRSLDPTFEREGFACVARYCPTAIHCVVIRRQILSNVGGFDDTLAVCEDWDLWQRAARSGIRIRMVEEVLATYVMGEATLSTQSNLMLRDGLMVMARGHGPDPRVPRPDERYAAGLPKDRLPGQVAYFTAWCLAAECGAGGDWRSLLAHLDNRALSAADVAVLAEMIVEGAIVGSRTPAEAMVRDFASMKPKLVSLAAALCEKRRLADFDRALLYSIETQLHRIGGDDKPRRIDLTSRITVDLQSIGTFSAPITSDVVIADLMWGCRRVATLRLAGFGGSNSGDLVEGAIDQIGVMKFIRGSAIWRRPNFWVALGRESVREAMSASRIARRRRSLSNLAARARGLAVLRSAAVATSVGATPAHSHKAAAWAAVRTTASGADRRVEGDVPSLAHSNESDPSPAEYWNKVFSSPDPWTYTSEYEQRKYERTLAMLPVGRDLRVLELACAEGLFTIRLAPRVGSLVASDISPTAIGRARARCEGLENIDFQTIDLTADPIPGEQDVIFCSEVLYYLETPETVGMVARKLREALVPGGRIIMANHFLLRDDMSSTGFDWDQKYGGKVIHEQFLTTPGLGLERSLVTELYRIDVFRHLADTDPRPAPIVQRAPLDSRLEPSLSRFVVWNGAVARRREVEHDLTWMVPVLVYHRVADDGPDVLGQWRVRSDEFERQLRLLRSNGYHAVTSDQLAEARAKRVPLTGRPVLVTFDDAYLDTATTAWPILRDSDFTAEVFVVTDHVGGAATWDDRFGPPAPLMDWNEVDRLAAEGMRFGSHLASHTPAPHLSSAMLLDEAIRSKRVLEEKTGQSVRSIAAPYGAIDQRLVQVCRRAGYEIGYSCDFGVAAIHDPRFIQPRIEVNGLWTLDNFASALHLKR